MGFIEHTVLDLELLEEGLVFVGAADHAICSHDCVQVALEVVVDDVVAELSSFL